MSLGPPLLSVRDLRIYERQPPTQQQDADSYDDDLMDGSHGLRSPFLKNHILYFLLGVYYHRSFLSSTLFLHFFVHFHKISIVTRRSSFISLVIREN